MHRLLTRQLRRAFGLTDDDSLPVLMRKIAGLSKRVDLDSDVARALTGLNDFIAKVNVTYAQNDRDLALRTRSLELSSEELNAANDRLRRELHGRTRAIASLRATANGLLEAFGDEPIRADDSGLETLSYRLADLVTQRERMERELRKVHVDLERQKAALDEHAIVSATDTEGRITYANDKFCSISGYSREELLGKTHRLVNAEYHPPALFRELWSTIESGQVWRGEVKNRNKDGGHYWSAVTVVPFVGEDGKPYQYVAIRTDITKRKSMEDELATSEEKYRSLVNNLKEVVFRADRSGVLTYLNPAWSEVSGYTVEETLGKPAAAFIVAKDQQRAVALFIETMKGRIDAPLGEFGLVSKDGRVRTIEIGASAERDASGRIIGASGVLSDISNRKIWEHEVLRARDAAEAANRAKSDFLANMSHEIRTPMNGIVGLAELLKATNLSTEQQRFVSLMKSSADALLVVINDILDFSKVEAGMLKLDAIEFDLRRVALEATRAVDYEAHRLGLDLSCMVAPEVPQRIVGDPGRLRQVLLNLLGNAVKFTKAGEVVLSVGMTATGQTDDAPLVQFSVLDTGIGISAEKQHDIFDAFVQGDSSVSRRYGGTGLGLSICSRLVSLMGGRIWLESEPGRGSVFNFTTRLQGPAAVPPECGAPAGWGNARCLVVDRHERARANTVAMMRSWGLVCDEVAEAEQALALLQADQRNGCVHRLVVADEAAIVIPGSRLAAFLRASARETAPSVVVLARVGSSASVAPVIDHASWACVVKPLDPVELKLALESLRPERAGLHSRSDHAARRSGTRALKILLAEDNAVNQTVAQALLQSLGHEVAIANDGIEALAMALNGAFDVVLMDVQMPHMDGIEATRRIRAAEAPMGQGVWIVAMTANVLPGDRERCLAVGMNGYVGKPFRQDDLIAVLSRVARRSSACAQDD